MRIRCDICNVKINLYYYECKCDSSKKFCSKHRYSHEHNCPIDYKKENQKLLEKLNPVVRPIKLETI